MEDDMAVEMAVDAMLWLILACGIALIWCGCILTARGGNESHGIAELPFEQRFDRAA